MRFLAALLALFIVLPVAADAVSDVRDAEAGFAKAFADRDKAKFFSYVADDAVFLNPLGTLRGKQQIVERWSRFFDGEAPFQWGPERVEVTGDGRIGFSMGPIYLPNGEHSGYYSSIWQKQGDGSWKVIVDGPGNPPPHLAENAAPFEEGFVPTPDGVKLHYRKLGNGPVTLIVPLDFALYDAMKQFADIATVIAYDLRSRGRSTRAENVKTLTIQQDVVDLETVRAHFKVEKFVPVGFSYLGKMVLLYAAAHPEHVRRVVQLGPVGNVKDALDTVSLSAEELKKLTMPVLTIHGTSDRNAPYAGGKAWAQQLPDARLVTVTGAAHAMWLDDPVAVFGAMRHFLRGEWPIGSEKVLQ